MYSSMYACAHTCINYAKHCAINKAFKGEALTPLIVADSVSMVLLVCWYRLQEYQKH